MGANMMLTIGSIVLFGIFLSSANRLVIGNNQIASQNEYYIAGLALAQSIIDEAKTKAFDEQTVTQAATSRSALTAPGSLGRDGAGEAVPLPDTLTSVSPYSPTNKGYYSALKFDDIDDYNGYSRLANTARAEGYLLSVSVSYASETYPDSAVSAKTYCKTMAVKVTSPFFPKKTDSDAPDTLTVSYTFTY
jgi:hypothetical protein